MPIIKSAKKRAKQNIVRKSRRLPFKTRMLTLFKNIRTLVSEKNKDKALLILKDTIQSIDTAAKKNIINKNNASRKISSIQRAVNSIASQDEIQKTLSAKTAPVKKASAKKTTAKTATVKKAPVKKTVKKETK